MAWPDAATDCCAGADWPDGAYRRACASSACPSRPTRSALQAISALRWRATPVAGSSTPTTTIRTPALFCHIDADSQVAVASHQDGITDGVMTSQFEQIGGDQGRNVPLLVSAV